MGSTALEISVNPKKNLSLFHAIAQIARLFRLTIEESREFGELPPSTF